MRYLVSGNPLTVVDEETGEVLKSDNNISFEINEMNAALYIHYLDKNDEYTTVGPIICWENVLEEVAKVTGDEEWLDYVEWEEE